MELNEEFWFFAAGVGLCVATFAAFLCTVFKDPGLPLENSSAKVQGQWLKPLTVGSHARKKLSKWLNQQKFRVQRDYHRSGEARKVFLRRFKNTPVTRFADEGEPDQHAMPYTGCGGPHTTLSKTPEDCETHKTPLRNGPASSSSEDSCGISSEDSCEVDRSRGSNSSSRSNSSDSDDSTDTRDSTDMRVSGSNLSEVIHVTRRVMKATDKSSGKPTCMGGKFSDGETRDCSRGDERVARQRHACTPERQPYKAARLNRNLIPSNSCVRSIWGKDELQASTSSPSVVGKTAGDCEHVPVYPTGEEAEAPVISVLSSLGEGAAELSVDPPHGPETTMTRRGYKVKAMDGLHRPGVQRFSEKATRSKMSFSGTYLRGPAADAVSSQVSGLPNLFPLRSYRKKRPGESLNLSQRGRRRGERVQTKRFPQRNSKSELRSRFCMACRIVPPVGAYHCEECDVCIEGYDHHCPWTSKCIGKGNTREFYTWILCTLVTIFYVGVATTLLNKNKDVDVGAGETRDSAHIRAAFSP